MGGRLPLTAATGGLTLVVMAGYTLAFVWISTPESAVYWLVLAGMALACGQLARRMAERAEAPISQLARRLAAVAEAPMGASPVPESGPRSPLEVAVADLHHRVTQSLEETRRNREAAQDAGVYKTAFLKAVSHELRTPLNAILGFTDVLLSGLEGDLSEGRRENLEVIRESGQRLLEIFNDCIDLSAMASGQLSLRRERVAVAGLLDEVVEAVEQRRGLQLVHLRAQVPEAPRERPLVISVQRDRLLRVMQTLGEFGLSRTDSGAVSFVAAARAERDGLHVIITLEDGGPAVSTANLQALFRPELAQDVSQRRLSLRLSIAKQLVELHGGHLELLADRPGRSFAVHLPLVS